MIKAIIFDIGGVLVNLDPAAGERAFNKMGINDISEVIDVSHPQGLAGDFVSGKISEDEYCSRVLSKALPGQTAADVWAAFSAFIREANKDICGVFHELKGRYKLLILSNIDPMAERRVKELVRPLGIDMESFFDEIYLSYKLGISKPSEGIYRAMLERTAFAPEEMFFIDDNLANVEVANRLGIKAVQYIPGQARDILDDFLK